MNAVEPVKYVDTGSLLIIVGKFNAGLKRTITFPEAVTADRMAMYAIYCQPMKYLGEQEFPAFITTPEFPERPAGSYVLCPTSEGEGFYVTSYLTGNLRMSESGWQAYDLAAPAGRKLSLLAGQTYEFVEGQALLLAAGQVSIAYKGETVVLAGPDFFSCPEGGAVVTAVTDTTFAEIWVPTQA